MSDDDSSEDIPMADLAATARVQRDIQQSEARIEDMASVMSESDKAEYYAKLKQLDKSGLAAYKFAATSWWTDANIKRSTTTTDRRP
jgi:hypothetical protein